MPTFSDTTAKSLVLLNVVLFSKSLLEANILMWRGSDLFYHMYVTEETVLHTELWMSFLHICVFWLCLLYKAASAFTHITLTHTLKHSVRSLLTAPLWTFAERCGMQWVEMRFCLWHTNTLWKLSALLRSVHFIMRSLKDWCIVCVSLLVGLNWCTPFTKNRI